MKDETYKELLRAGYILFVDIVGFSKFKMKEQLETINTLEKLVLSCAQVNSRKRMNGYLFIPTGDGFALAFLDSPDAPLLTALDLAEKVKQASIPCRMGLHIGPVYLREDINQHLNLTGGGINVAQRVMDFGDDGHILASREIRNWLCEVKTEYEPLFHYLGLYRAKHDVIIELYNVFNQEVGNKKVPSKGRVRGGNRRLFGPDDPLIASQREILGRKMEIDQVVTFLESEEKLGIVTASYEVVNVTGSPGIGKTEVCKAALRQWLVVGSERIAYYVGLAGAQEISEFITRLAEAYNIAVTTSFDDLLARIANNSGVLYLDNLEGLLSDPEAIELLKRLQDIPAIRIIASSRERLAGIGRDIPINALELDYAVRLFCQEWEKGGENIEDSQELRKFIEKDLGCHPLSIILVAAQAPFYPTLESIRNAWKEKGTHLARLYRGKEDRLTNLDISMSLSLSSVNIQPEGAGAILLWGLMVFFPDGMSEKAWQFFQENAKIGRDCLNLLIRLNLVNYGSIFMLPPLQRFAEGKALSKEDGFDLDALIEIVYPYFLGISGQAEKHSFNEQHLTTLNTILSEFPNIHRFIIIVSEKRKDLAEKLTAISFSLSNFYQFHAFAGIEILERLLPLQKEASLNIPTAHSLKYLGDLESRLGKIDEAEAHYKEAIELYRQERANLGLANVFQSYGDLYRYRREFIQAKELYNHAKELYIAERDNMGLAYTCSELARIWHALGNARKRDQLLEQALAAAKDSNVPGVLKYVNAVFEEFAGDRS